MIVVRVLVLTASIVISLRVPSVRSNVLLDLWQFLSHMFEHILDLRLHYTPAIFSWLLFYMCLLSSRIVDEVTTETLLFTWFIIFVTFYATSLVGNTKYLSILLMAFVCTKNFCSFPFEL